MALISDANMIPEQKGDMKRTADRERLGHDTEQHNKAEDQPFSNHPAFAD